MMHAKYAYEPLTYLNRTPPIYAADVIKSNIIYLQ